MLLQDMGSFKSCGCRLEENIVLDATLFMNRILNIVYLHFEAHSLWFMCRSKFGLNRYEYVIVFVELISILFRLLLRFECTTVADTLSAIAVVIVWFVIWLFTAYTLYLYRYYWYLVPQQCSPVCLNAPQYSRLKMKHARELMLMNFWNFRNYSIIVFSLLFDSL